MKRNSSPLNGNPAKNPPNPNTLSSGTRIVEPQATQPIPSIPRIDPPSPLSLVLCQPNFLIYAMNSGTYIPVRRETRTAPDNETIVLLLNTTPRNEKMTDPLAPALLRARNVSLCGKKIIKVNKTTLIDSVAMTVIGLEKAVRSTLSTTIPQELSQ